MNEEPFDYQLKWKPFIITKGRYVKTTKRLKLQFLPSSTSTEQTTFQYINQALTTAPLPKDTYNFINQAQRVAGKRLNSHFKLQPPWTRANCEMHFIYIHYS